MHRIALMLIAISTSALSAELPHEIVGDYTVDQAFMIKQVQDDKQMTKDQMEKRVASEKNNRNKIVISSNKITFLVDYGDIKGTDTFDVETIEVIGDKKLKVGLRNQDKEIGKILGIMGYIIEYKANEYVTLQSISGDNNKGMFRKIKTN